MKPFEYGSLLTIDPRLNSVMQTANNVSVSKATVLISGESGTGKELVAKYIHERSPRAHQRFVAINCAALPEGLLESELFGFEKGAFTGALNQKIGKFELASGSTILLDEISEMPLTLQAKLLRVLQEEEVDRLGGRNPIKVNIRVIATTNRDLRAMVKAHLFREDLYYRLNVIPLHIPPLRDRPGDLICLAHHFVQVSAVLNQKPVLPLKSEAVKKIQTWSWPGNVRELENVMERAVLMSQNGEITADHILLDQGLTDQSLASGGSGYAPVITIAQMEKELIYRALEQTKQNRTQAAKVLGISIRTLRNKLHEYNGAALEEVNCG